MLETVIKLVHPPNMTTRQLIVRLVLWFALIVLGVLIWVASGRLAPGNS